MPLGKISKKQIKGAYLCLDKIQQHLARPADEPRRKKLLEDESTQFYTLIPHSFPSQAPPTIDTLALLEKKIQLLDTLCDIEVAGQVMKGKLDEDDPVRQNYNKLRTKLVPLDKNSEMYKLLEQYAHNSHDRNWFSHMRFEVEDIFEVEREGEKERFAPWANNHNKMLLWHGSRLTNWVGILSTGLRIAPPEAPTTGYRFGKGVYLADVISKSASYCFTNSSAPTSCMLLAETALGTMNELKQDQYMEKPPKGTDSTKALGKAAPAKGQISKYKTILDNVIIPQGKVEDTGVKSTCSHNEYIVYDVSQILIRYLFRIRFHH